MSDSDRTGLATGVHWVNGDTPQAKVTADPERTDASPPEMTRMNARHRIGLMVPSSNTTMETELPSLLRARERKRPQDNFTFHAARLRLEDVTPEALRAMNAQTQRATTELADLRPNVVATACLVAIMAQGPRHHHVVQAEIESILAREDAPAPVVSSAGALVDALHALGARRIGMVTPYLKGLTSLVAAYIEDAGIEVGDALSLEVSDNRAVAALDPEDLKTHWKRLDLRNCDALVLSACVQMPSLSAIEEVDRQSGLPTLSAATATTWAILRVLNLEPVVPGAGQLLRSAPDRVA
jgi:maleate isomerase